LLTSPLIALDARLAWGTATGDSTYWTGLILGLAEASFPATFLLFSDQPRPAQLPDVPHLRWRQITARNPRFWSLVTFPLAARKAGATRVHTQYNLSPLVRRGGITTIHDVSFFIGPDWFRPRDRLLLQKFVPRSAQRAQAVLTVSETSKAEIEHWIPRARGKTWVTPNALNPLLPQVEPDEAAAHRLRLGIDEDPYLLCVGTRWPRKNTALALEATRRLSREFPHRLLLTGKEGWGPEELHDRVVPTGYVRWPELAALYQGASLTLIPSWHEGFGLVPLEAWSQGCPVLASSGGALPEIVRDSEAIVPTWEPDAWAAKIENLLADSSTLDAMTQAGRTRLADFSWRQTATATWAAYQLGADGAV